MAEKFLPPELEAKLKSLFKELPIKPGTLTPNPAYVAGAKPMPLNERIYALLGEGNGVLLGEEHDKPILRQVLAQYMPELKKRGVGTISLEIPQSVADSMKEAATYADFKKAWPNFAEQALHCETLYDVVKKAQAQDMVVLGHEEPLRATHEKYLRGLPVTAKEIAEENKVAQEKDAMVPEMLERRDAHAAKHITTHAKGKVVVLSGVQHSGKYSAQQARDNVRVMTLNDHVIVTKGGEPLVMYQGLPVGQDFKGLDKRLGYSSIDFDVYYDLDRQAAYPLQVKDLLQTRQTNGQFNDYEVMAPRHLEEMRQIPLRELLKPMQTPAVPNDEEKRKR